MFAIEAASRSVKLATLEGRLLSGDIDRSTFARRAADIGLSGIRPRHTEICPRDRFDTNRNAVTAPGVMTLRALRLVALPRDARDVD